MTDRPLDPSDLLAQGIARTSKCPIEVARLEAEPLLEFLGENGAHLVYSISLPELAPSGSRETSRKAAASIHDLKCGQRGVFELVACNGSHGLTDEQINDQYPGFARSNGFPQLAADSPRKRRQSLTDAGHLVDSGRTRKTRSGNDAMVWIAAAGRAAVAA